MEELIDTSCTIVLLGPDTVKENAEEVNNNSFFFVTDTSVACPVHDWKLF